MRGKNLLGGSIMRRVLLAVGIAVFTWTAAARAGGPPPMYVIVEKVVLESGESIPERIRIQGVFTRTKGRSNGMPDEKYREPVRGYLYLEVVRGQEKACRSEWARWQKAAGSGQVVAVGCCYEAGAFLTVPIHKPSERVNKPDGAYPLGHLDKFPPGSFDDTPEVKKLLAFARK
jgi:hypothetical protein